jgi:xanthine dehydrogenase small subunit
MISKTIKFVWNNKIIEIKNPDPNETLLNFIRLKLKKTGTKEGCSEGGCGACTVVLVEEEKNDLNYKAINSCISFVTILHGKQLILVEDLLNNNGSLHPVQKAMVDYHGSQCGFCTPGFVMSLFAMHKKSSSFDEKTINDSLSGNLCRCTGYRPIIDAAKSLKKKKIFDKFQKLKERTLKLLKKIKFTSISINNGKKYFAPTNIRDLKKILNTYPNSKLLSGGTDLSLVVTKQRNNLDNLIYMGAITELNYIKKNKSFIEIGATTPLIRVEEYIKKYYSDFNKILKRYGSLQIRNVATIAGNIATASPIGDMLPLLLSLDAIVLTESLNKKKIIKIKDLFTGYRKTRLKKTEFIRAIKIPFYPKNIFKAYKISKRIDDDISSVCASFNFEIKNKKIKNVKIAFGGMSSIPKRAKYCEKILQNNEFTEKILTKAKQSLTKDFMPISDMRASKEYRIEIAKNLLTKCFAEIQNKKTIGIN